MVRLLFDTNAVLDYFGVSTTEENRKAALDLVKEILSQEGTFLVTPTTLKDFRYLFEISMKRVIRNEEGSLSQKDALVVQRVADAALERLMDICSIASEDLASCEMARVLCKQHADYEDNLIAAVAMRANAVIVTRDQAFARHCPVMCVTPKQALSYLQSGVWTI